MVKIFKIIIIFFIFAITNILTFFAYFQLEMDCGNDYPEYIITSEGNIQPMNLDTTWGGNRSSNYLFYFPIMKHNFSNPICIKWFNYGSVGSFAFNKAFINEYDITIVNYEDYYFCNDCNVNNTTKKFKTTTSICSPTQTPLIWTSDEKNRLSKHVINICLNPTNNISNFYISENKINNKFYKGKKVEYIFNNESDIFKIDDIFTINEDQNLQIYLDIISFKIVNISNKEKAHIYNGDEELFENSFFNAKNNYLSFKKISDEGFLMIIKIQTKPLNMNINISTCENEAEIYLYVYQKNCTINITSNDFCQNCIPEYGKLGNKCYEKTEKIDNYYYSNQIWKECETNKNIFTCSVCPQGTYIKNVDSKICEKCLLGEYNNEKDRNNCNKCMPGYFCEVRGAIECSECLPGTYSNEEGMEKCLLCEKGTYNNDYKQTECYNCQKGYFSSYEGSIECSECPPGTFSSLIKSIQCQECDFGFYNDKLGSDECKLCPFNYFSDEKGSTFCKKCEDNKYSQLGFSKCKYCEEIISNCNICSKDLICLECNNYAKNGYDNCKICENEVDWKFNGEYCELITVCQRYFYKDKKDNNKINCINDITECPESMGYLNLDTRECKDNVNTNDLIKYQYQVKGGEESLNDVSNKIIFKEKNFDDALIDFLNNNRVIIKGINSNLQIGYEENLKNYYKDNIGINLGNCLDVIRLKYGIKNGTNIIYKVIDVNFNGTRYVNYTLYNTDDLRTPLNLTPCENQTVTIINPPLDLSLYANILQQEYEEIFQQINDGNQIFTIYDEMYKNYPCFSLDSLDKYYHTLKERRKFIKEKNITLCEEQCKYEGENLTSFQIICYCPIKTEMNKNITLKSLKEGFLDINNSNNFKVLKCYKLTFSSEGQKSNYFSYVFIAFFVLNIIFIICLCPCNNSRIDKLIKKCKLFIYNNKFNDEFKELRNKFLNKEIDNEYEKYKRQYILEEQREIKNKKKELKNEYYYYLIYCYRDNIKGCKKFLIDDELNDLEYFAYRQLEKRNNRQIYCSIFKSEYNFIKIFSFLKEDYKLYPIEIMIYLNSLIISIIINISFYTDNTMHKIYDKEGNYNIINSLPQIFVSNLTMEIINLGYEELIDFQEKFIELKNNLELSNIEEEKRKNLNTNSNSEIIINYSNNHRNFNPVIISETNPEYRTMNDNNIININQVNLFTYNSHENNSSNNEKVSKDKNAEYIKKCFRKRSVIFYCIIIIINCFGWYYASCFSAVFKNTQKHLLINFLISIPFNIIICGIISSILFLIHLLKKKHSFLKCVDNTYGKFLIRLIIIIIEIILEGLIIYITS